MRELSPASETPFKLKGNYLVLPTTHVYIGATNTCKHIWNNLVKFNKYMYQKLGWKWNHLNVAASLRLEKFSVDER